VDFLISKRASSSLLVDGDNVVDLPAPSPSSFSSKFIRSHSQLETRKLGNQKPLETRWKPETMWTTRTRNQKPGEACAHSLTAAHVGAGNVQIGGCSVVFLETPHLPQFERCERFSQIKAQVAKDCSASSGSLTQQWR